MAFYFPATTLVIINIEEKIYLFAYNLFLTSYFFLSHCSANLNLIVKTILKQKILKSGKNFEFVSLCLKRNMLNEAYIIEANHISYIIFIPVVVSS